MQQRLTLTRTSDDNAIFKTSALKHVDDGGGDQTVDGKIILSRIRWFMPHVVPSDEYRLHIDKIIEKKEKLPVGYRMLQCDNTQVPANSTNFTWKLGVKSSPDIPRFIIVGFQRNKNNSQKTNPAIFDHLDLRNIYVTLNAKRYPYTDFDISFPENRYSRIYGDTALFRKKFYNMDELISNCNIDPIEYKNFFPLFLFDVSKQSEKLKTSVSDIHIKATFNDNPEAGVMGNAVIISDRIFHSVSDGSKITNIV